VLLHDVLKHWRATVCDLKMTLDFLDHEL